MARIPEHVIQQVLDSIDLVDLVSEYLTLKRAGGRFKGLCPFHQEKTPSFTVNPDMGIFKCFGCGKGGNAISFVMESEGLSYPQAIRHLAEKTGVVVAEESREDQAVRSRQEMLQTVLKAACDDYRKCYKQAMHGDTPLASYVAGREIDRDCEDHFQLGWAEDGWQHITDLGAKLGFPQDLLVESGLCVQNESGRVYDRYRGRLIFPIRSVSGTVIGFGGRLIADADGQAKYINSPETPLYHKSRALYGIFECKNHIRHERCAVLVEGYMDLIRLYGAGVKNVAASLGTALTAEQGLLLKRFSDRVIFLYDGDSAGQAAMARGAINLLSAGLDLRVCRLPEGQDPDDFIRTEGPEAMKQALEESIDYFQYRITEFQRIRKDATPIQFKEFVQGLSQAAGEVGDLLHRSQLCQRISSASGVPLHEVERLSQVAGSSRTPVRQESGSVFLDLKALTRTQRRERDLLQIFLRCPEVRDTLAEELDLDELAHPFFRNALQQAFVAHMDDERSVEAWCQELANEQLKRLVLEAMTEVQRPGDPQEAQDLLDALRKGRIEERMQAINSQMQAPGLPPAERSELEQEFARLLREKNAG